MDNGQKVPAADELRQLPLLGIVAFAARCLERVADSMPSGTINQPAHRNVGSILAWAWATAGEKDTSGLIIERAQQAIDEDADKNRWHLLALVAHQVHETANHADTPTEKNGSATAFFAAEAARIAAKLASMQGKDIVVGIRADFAELCRMELGRFPELGKPLTRQDLTPIRHDA